MLAAALATIEGTALAQPYGSGMTSGPGMGRAPGLGHMVDPCAHLDGLKAQLGFTEAQAAAWDATPRWLRVTNAALEARVAPDEPQGRQFLTQRGESAVMQAFSRRMMLTGALAAIAGTAVAQPCRPGLTRGPVWAEDLHWGVWPIHPPISTD